MEDTTMSETETAVTMHDVNALIQYESNEPDAILAALRPYAGKPITKRLLDKLPGGSDRWRLRREYGMTHLATMDYIRTQGNAGMSFLMAYSESAVPLDLDFFVKRNECYFSAREERNHARMEAKNTRETLESAAAVLARVRAAIAEMNAAVEAFDTLTACGTTLYPDRYDLETAAGLRDAKHRRFINPEYSR
jgi:hypothetical protein